MVSFLLRVPGPSSFLLRAGWGGPGLLVFTSGGGGTIAGGGGGGGGKLLSLSAAFTAGGGGGGGPLAGWYLCNTGRARPLGVRPVLFCIQTTVSRQHVNTVLHNLNTKFSKIITL